MTEVAVAAKKSGPCHRCRKACCSTRCMTPTPRTCTRCSISLTWKGPVDPARLRAAGQALLDRHVNLRAGFTADQLRSAVQVIPRRAVLPWQETDLSGEPDPRAAVRR